MVATSRAWLVVASVLGCTGLMRCTARFDDIPCERNENCPPTLPACVAHVCAKGPVIALDGGNGGGNGGSGGGNGGSGGGNGGSGGGNGGSGGGNGGSGGGNGGSGGGNGGSELGVLCASGTNCASGHCVDGVCCNSTCTGELCQRCDSASVQGAGHCGYAAAGADLDHDCPPATANCAGLCQLHTTTYSCTGSSYACAPHEALPNISTKQVCAGDAGVPVSKTGYCFTGNDCTGGSCQATRWWTSCDGNGGCRPSSDRTDAFSEAVLAASGASLSALCETNSPAHCDNTKQCGVDVLYSGHTCDGAGACTLGDGVSCGTFACDSSALQCKAACSVDGDCATGLVCYAPECRWDREWVSWDVTNPKSYTTNANTVTDNQTGLVWERVAASTLNNWSAARAYCDALTLDGHSDWRLPTVIELKSIVDPTRSSPVVDASVFSGASNGIFWSSTPYIGGGQAWFVAFNSGVTYAVTTSTKYSARCVR